jgi:hypothetical protein
MSLILIILIAIQSIYNVESSDQSVAVDGQLICSYENVSGMVRYQTHKLKMSLFSLWNFLITIFLVSLHKNTVERI